jgi:SAM-dependent methyltransferase
VFSNSVVSRKYYVMTDNSWKIIGNEDPYYGVLTTEAFKGRNLDENTINSFYQTGVEHVAYVISELNRYLDVPAGHVFEHVLDFGCGTGRLVIPFAEKYKRVTGIDISEGMLKEASIHIQKKGLTNISLLQVDDFVAYDLKDTYDLVHTYIVLQHINEQYGYKIINKLASVIRPGGYGIIQLLYDGNMSGKDRFISKLKRKYKWFINFQIYLKAGP